MSDLLCNLKVHTYAYVERAWKQAACVEYVKTDLPAERAGPRWCRCWRHGANNSLVSALEAKCHLERTLKPTQPPAEGFLLP